ncbi:hypothetical protein EBS02_11720, partial [bacterium]|nr:hypothetical protein [bacterium]
MAEVSSFSVTFRDLILRGNIFRCVPQLKRITESQIQGSERTDNGTIIPSRYPSKRYSVCLFSCLPSKLYSVWSVALCYLFLVFLLALILGLIMNLWRAVSKNRKEKEAFKITPLPESETVVEEKYLEMDSIEGLGSYIRGYVQKRGHQDWNAIHYIKKDYVILYNFDGHGSKRQEKNLKKVFEFYDEIASSFENNLRE